MFTSRPIPHLYLSYHTICHSVVNNCFTTNQLFVLGLKSIKR